MVNYARTIRDKVRENDAVMQQIAANTAEQAMLGDFPRAVEDAVLASGKVHENQMMQLIEDPEKAKKFTKLILEMLMREGDDGDGIRLDRSKLKHGLVLKPHYEVGRPSPCSALVSERRGKGCGRECLTRSTVKFRWDSAGRVKWYGTIHHWMSTVSQLYPVLSLFRNIPTRDQQQEWIKPLLKYQHQ